jgi:hypothetical protein
MGGGRERWTRTRKPKIWIASAQEQGRAGQGRTSVEQDKHRAERAGQGRAEQSRLQPAASKQPETLKQLTAEGGDHRTTHLAHRSTCCSQTASRERASAEELESIEGLRVSVSLCLRVSVSSRLHVFTSSRLHVFTSSRLPVFPSSRPSSPLHSEYWPRWGPAPVMRHPRLVIPSALTTLLELES